MFTQQLLLGSAATYSLFCVLDTLQQLPLAFAFDGMIVTLLLWLALRSGAFD